MIASTTTTHRPKTLALLAYEEGLLSPEGVRRLEKHLVGCPICQAELAAIRAYQQTADEVRETPAPALSFEKMSAVLEEEAERISRPIVRRRRRQRWALPGFGLALALGAALLWVLVPTEPESAPVAMPTPVEPGPVAPPAPAPEAAYEATVTLAAGEAVRIGHDGARTPLTAGMRLEEGARVEAGDGLHLELTTDSGVALEPGAVLTLASLRPSETRLSLEKGRSHYDVRAWASDSRFVVLAAQHEVEVKGTRFTVLLEDLAVGVQVDEGVVEVRGPDGTETLSAPARWPEGGEAVTAVPPARGAEGGLHLAHRAVIRWSVNGREWASPTLSLALPHGEHEVRGWDARGRRYEATPLVAGPSVELVANELREVTPVSHAGSLEPAHIQAVVRGGQPSIRRCYERALRNQPTLNVNIRVRVRVGADGSVRRVRVDGTGASAAMRDCIEAEAQRWTFDEPGGYVDFEVPFAFSPRR